MHLAPASAKSDASTRRGRLTLDPENPGAFLIGVEEIRSATHSYYWDDSSGEIQDRSPRPHVLHLTFNVDSSPEAPQGHTITRMVGVLTPAELANYVEDELQGLENPNPQGSGNIIWSAWANNRLDAHLAPDPQSSGQSPLSAQPVTVVVYDKDQWTEGQTQKVHHYFYFLEYDIEKVACSDASADSRVGYPVSSNSLDVLYGTDPNGLARDLNFGSSTFRGGLFAGNMYWNGFPQDQSGTGRIQLWPGETPDVEDVAFATLSLLDCGRVPLSHQQGGYVGAPDLGLFSPDTTNDTHLGTTEGSLVWSTRWSIAPRATAQSPYPTWLDPIDHKLLNSTPPDPKEYVNWSVTRIGAPFANPLEPYTPEGALQYLCIALCDEATVVSNNTSAWAYFASKEFEDLGLETFPENDCAPRLWVVKKPVITLYSYGD